MRWRKARGNMFFGILVVAKCRMAAGILRANGARSGCWVGSWQGAILDVDSQVNVFEQKDLRRADESKMA
ncbi:MAG: hypothetical protein IAF94_04690 [Pirellulaceae bacterium]|nr:hypothetical protein [Pirellulaceae bacterium]